MSAAIRQAGMEVSSGAARAEEAAGGDHYDSFMRFTSVRSKGLVTQVDTLMDRQDWMEIAGASSVLTHRVELRALVQPTQGEPDPAFRLEMNLDQSTYRDGETMTITLQPTVDCYVTLLNLYSNDSLSILLPNVILGNNRISADSAFTLPPKDAYWDLPVELAPGTTDDREALLAVATRKPIPFPMLEGALQRGLLARGNALLEVNRWLVDIPLDQRAEAWEFYRVVE